jgi:hypothetical protein
MIGRIAGASILAFVATASTASIAAAGTIYDGQWNLTITTERGTCEASYHFVVDINNGIVSHPNLVKLHGRVAKGGSVQVSVSAAGKTAAGAGRMSRSSGRGRWTGHSGQDRCSGSWAAQRL